MKTYGFEIAEGGSIKNITVPTGTSFPGTPNDGEMYYRTDGGNEGLYVYSQVLVSWSKIYHTGNSSNIEFWVQNVTDLYYTLGNVGIGNSAPSVKLDVTGAVKISSTLVMGTATGGAQGSGTINAQNLYVNATPVLTGNQSITISGDVSGTGTTAITATLPNIATAGTYNSVTINTKGQVT